MDGMNVIVKRLVISVKENTRELRFYIHIEYKVIGLIWNKKTKMFSKYKIILDLTPFYLKLLETIQALLIDHRGNGPSNRTYI